jgi:hypothetical protein
MRRNYVLGAAVASILGASSAHAATTWDIFVSGSSALGTFFQKDAAATLCNGAASTKTVYNGAGGATLGNVPIYNNYSCVIAAGSTIGSAAVGDTVIIHYASDLGSTWGIAGMINTALTRDQFFTAGANVNSTFNRVTDLDTGGQQGVTMKPHASDILVSDVEPNLFTADNWPTANGAALGTPNAINSVPTKAQLALLSPIVMNGQVFAVIGTDGSHGTGTAIPGSPKNLSRASVRAIISGQYTTWSQVPEVGASDAAGTNIQFCRRDHGSGTELSVDVAFNKFTCSLAKNEGNEFGAAQVVENGKVVKINNMAAGTVTEVAATADMVDCVQNHNAAIGIVTLQTTTGFTTFTIDGAAPNAHNAAAGMYPYAFEDVAQDNTGNSGASGTVKLMVSALLSDAQDQTKLGAFFTEAATQNANPNGNGEAPGTYHVALAGASGFFALQNVGSGPNSPTPAAGFAGVGTPVSAWDQGGASCGSKINVNP